MAKKRKSKKDYFGLSYLVSVILAIIPITSVILGIVVRFQENTVAGLVRLLIAVTGIGAGILWVVDLLLMILNKSILRLIH